MGVGGVTDQLPVRLRGLGGEGGPGRRGHGKRCPWGTATCLSAGMWLAMAIGGSAAAARALNPPPAFSSSL